MHVNLVLSLNFMTMWLGSCIFYFKHFLAYLDWSFLDTLELAKNRQSSFTVWFTFPVDQILLSLSIKIKKRKNIFMEEKNGKKIPLNRFYCVCRKEKSIYFPTFKVSRAKNKNLLIYAYVRWRKLFGQYIFSLYWRFAFLGKVEVSELIFNLVANIEGLKAYLVGANDLLLKKNWG